MLGVRQQARGGRSPRGLATVCDGLRRIPYCRQRADLIAATMEEMPHLGREAAESA